MKPFRVGLVCAAILLGSSPLAHGSDSMLAVDVAVEVRGLVDGCDLVGARGVASRIFAATGVRLMWSDASLPGVPVSRLTVVIVSAANEKKDLFGKERVLGRVGQPGVRAYVRYDRVVRLARQRHTDEARLLGAVMAHEIGHLLLGEGHSTTGLMIASVDARPSADPRFTREQAEALRTVLSRDHGGSVEQPRVTAYSEEGRN